jgi:ABC-type arginine transport system permease subunit
MSHVPSVPRIMVPQAARFAIPGLGNVWQLVLKGIRPHFRRWTG